MHLDAAAIPAVKVDQALTRVKSLCDMDLHRKNAPNQMVLRNLERMRRLWEVEDCEPLLGDWDVAAYIAGCMTEEQYSSATTKGSREVRRDRWALQEYSANWAEGGGSGTGPLAHNDENWDDLSIDRGGSIDFEAAVRVQRTRQV